ncbi:phospholipid phosphatase 3 [Aplysia californica]|uniref:Phospholipid phosphatase 3 n=1 Tax=Aplysia californica TaxID=6500 RepID=A0ABM1A9H5_APLCA|nr:phospholipid phosphatase 3 [Aplysia californica]
MIAQRSVCSVFGLEAVVNSVINVVTFAAGVAALSAVHYLVPVHQRGFYCNDESIQFPYKTDTVSSASLFASTLGTAVVVITLSVMLQKCRPERTGEKTGSLSETGAIRTILHQIFVLLFGLVMTLLMTEIFKVSAGRLRPCFLSVCNVDADSYNCSVGYVTDYTCTQTNQALLTDSRKSFLSGHASVAFYNLVFTILYLQHQITEFPRCILPKTLLQVLCLSLASYICVSRVTDNKHHPTDVIAGAGLGVLLAVVADNVLTTMPALRRNRGEGNLQEVKSF